MGRTVYIPINEKTWCDFYLCQAKQTGHGINGFQGQAYQRGNGLGSFFGRLFRNIFPIVKQVGKSIGKTVGREALDMGVNVIGDVVKGKKPKESMKTRGLNAAERPIKESRNGYAESVWWSDRQAEGRV